MPLLDLDGITLHYEDEGAGEPIILIHGFPLSSELWRPQRAALSANYRVISPDLRGMGRTDPTPGSPSIDLYADDIVALMDALGIAQATVAGLSMGGYVLMALLRRRPDRVRGVILLSTKATPDTEEGKKGRTAMIELARDEGAAAVAAKMLPGMLTERTRSENEELTAYARTMMEGTPVEGIVMALTAMRARPDSTPTLKELAVPALILVGADDKITTVADAEAMRDAIPDARLEVIPAAAHLLNLEQPEAVNAAITAFLRSTTDH